jgi:hypothetical protein
MITYHFNQYHSNNYLAKPGVVSIQNNSWLKESLSKKALRKLVLAGLKRHIDSESQDYSNIVSCNLPPNQSAHNSLEAYFQNFFEWIAKDILKKQRRKINTNIVAINCMPFALTKSIAHKILYCLYIQLQKNKHLNRPGTFFVFLSQNTESFLECKISPRFETAQDILTKIALIDYRGYSYIGSSPQKHHLPRELYYDVLKLDDRAIYNKLIFDTNNYIGHFKLDGAHVRTHYDLTDFVRHNDVQEKILSQVNGLIKDFNYVWVIYAGIEDGALTGICSSIESHISSPLCESFPVYGIDKRLHEKPPESILLLTDIVCSGDTLRRIIKVIRNIDRPTPLKIIPYTIICMENSCGDNRPKTIEGIPLNALAEIKREYYVPDNNLCKLCKVNQPGKRVSSVSDFQVINDHFTPYDFWEIVHDCQAFRVREKESTGRQLEVRVETSKIFERYKHWLHNIIIARYRNVFGDLKPSLILTVNEEGGVAFSELICGALYLETNIIKVVDRVMLESPSTPCKNVGGKSILLVDDGLNCGDTMKLLISHCRMCYGEQPMGVFVFDSRLEESQEENLKVGMGPVPIMCLYRWPGLPKHYKEQ